MSALACLQQDFRAALLDEDRPCALSAPGMAAYRNTYRAQLLACLAETFPVLAAWLGEEDFTHLAIAYALECPPQSWSLDHFPARFAPWLEARGEEALWVDLASIEWALGECFVAPDEAVLGPADLGAVDWDQARLALHGACRLLPLTTNAAAIWVSIQHEEPLPEPSIEQPSSEPCHLLVWRRDEQCHLRALDALEHDLLSKGAFAFADMCDHVCERLGEEAGLARAGGLLAQWAGEGILRLN